MLKAIYMLMLAINMYSIAGRDLYSLVSKSDEGTLTLKAWKQYNFWGPKNETFYQIGL